MQDSEKIELLSKRVDLLETRLDTLRSVVGNQVQDESISLTKNENFIETGPQHTPNDQAKALAYNKIFSWFQNLPRRHKIVTISVCFTVAIIFLSTSMAYTWNTFFKEVQPAVIFNQYFDVERYYESGADRKQADEFREMEVHENNSDMIEKMNKNLNDSEQQ